ncbi:histidine phosphatase family protein [Agrilactobacillus fermenti]|uniref:histidine phosphatase family protein n=1 Tax=Agrilactobacillus fermenti TaxID=2586909 RepID=UPI003A5BACC6
MTELYLIRHGRTDANDAGIKQGTINTPNTYLNQTGQQQAQLLHQYLDLAQFTHIYASPLVRTKQTAAILNQTAQLPITYDQRLLEISYGLWDGQANIDLERQFPTYFDPVIHDVRPNYATIAQGETFQHVEQRVADISREIVQNFPENKILIVTHGFTVRSFAMNALHPQTQGLMEPDNCSVSKLSIDAQTQAQHLIYYNRTVAGF